MSLAWDGSDGDGNSGGPATGPALSADGSVVAFESDAANLVEGDENGVRDVFVRDHRAGTIERVSVTPDGAEGTAPSSSPSISADGRLVLFTSRARLVPLDTDHGDDVYLHDRMSGETRLVSRSSSGETANSISGPGVISADGSTAVFTSRASNLVSGMSGPHVYAVDLATGAVALVSRSTGGTPANEMSLSPRVSADGRQVVFVSRASNLLAGDGNGDFDVFVHDRQTGETALVSVNDHGEQVDTRATGASISADGRTVAFASDAGNLVPDARNGWSDIYVRDLDRGTTTRVSVTSAGQEVDGASTGPVLSADGRYVAFVGYTSALAPGAGNFGDVYVHDRELGRTERMLADDGSRIGGQNGAPVISADGAVVGLTTKAGNLGRGSGNGHYDVYTLRRGPAVGPLHEPTVAPTADGFHVAGAARFAGGVLASTTREPTGETLQDLPTGEELTGFAVAYRRDEEELVFRIGLADLPNTFAAGPLAAGAPGMVYGATFALDGVDHELRVQPATGWMVLLRCETTCSPVTYGLRDTYGLGTTGQELLVPVALADLGAVEGSSLSGLRAYSGGGSIVTGAIEELDAVDLGDVTVPSRTASIGIAAPGAPAGEVELTAPLTLSGDAFDLEVSSAGLPPGPATVWLQLCDTGCSTTPIPVTIGTDG